MEQATHVDETLALGAVLAGAADFLASDPALAEKQASEILKMIPGQPHALTMLVDARRVRGDTKGLIEMLQSMSVEYPDIAAIRYELGALLLERGDGQDAIRELSRVVELEPGHQMAWRLLGDAQSAAGDLDGAGKAWVRHFESSVIDLRTLEAAVALGSDKAEIVEKVLREFLTLHPTDVVATHMLGKLCLQLQLPEDAERFLSRAIELAPDFAPAIGDYHSALQQQMKWEQLLGEYDRLLEEDPENTECRFGKAATLSRLGEHRQSLSLYEGLIRDKPDEPRFWAAFAHELRTLGRRDECVAAYRRSIELDPGYGEAWWSLGDLKTFRFPPEDIARMGGQLSRHDLTAEGRYCLHFALGGALEQKGEYSTSFEHYREANNLRRAELSYDADDATQNVRRIKARYTRDFFRRHGELGCLSVDPIFIIGLPRSGSTLVEQILASHSSIEGTGELPCFVPIAVRFGRIEATVCPPEDTKTLLDFEAENLRAAGEEYIERCKIFRKLSRPHFTDKSPSNFHHVGLICTILPNAKIVDVRRHPMACCFSNFKQFFPAGVAQSYDLTDIGRYYRDYVDLLAHFDRVLPGRIHRVFYENLVRDPEGQIRALLDYCDVPFEQACLHFYRSNRPVLTVSSEQVRQPIHARALDQWRHYEQWLDPLKAALGPVLEAYPAIPDGFGES